MSKKIVIDWLPPMKKAEWIRVIEEIPPGEDPQIARTRVKSKYFEEVLEGRCRNFHVRIEEVENEV